MKIAIIGSGIAGNVVAHHLHREHEIAVYEAAGHAGGHTHTHSIALDGERHEIDTGFIVFNDRTYPNFIALLAELGVESQPSAMSFSVHNELSGLEYNGTTLNSLFAQRRNLFRPTFHRMLRDILRFNREAPALLESANEIPLGDYLAQRCYSREFIRDYLIPMGAAIWSTDPARMLSFPARFFVRFFQNHGMLSVNNRPQWRAIRGGSARYVEKLIAPFRGRIRLNTPIEMVRRLPDRVMVKARGVEPERFDDVFLACHADQALRMLVDATPLEREVVGAFGYQKNEAVLHTDTGLLPRTRRAWAAWNYHVAPAQSAATLTYNMNILQNLESCHTFCVTLNRTSDIAPGRIIKRLTYEHPLYTPAAVAAQRRQHEVNGVNRTYFCGAYWRYGFHEDGVVSALQAVDHLHQRLAQGDKAPQHRDRSRQLRLKVFSHAA
jgi:uncharacterized protein